MGGEVAVDGGSVAAVGVGSLGGKQGGFVEGVLDTEEGGFVIRVAELGGGGAEDDGNGEGEEEGEEETVVVQHCRCRRTCAEWIGLHGRDWIIHL